MNIVIESGETVISDSFYYIAAKEILGYDDFSRGFAGIAHRRLLIGDDEIDMWAVIIVPREGDIRAVNFAAVKYNSEKNLIRRLYVSTTRLEKELNKQRHEKEVPRN